MESEEREVSQGAEEPSATRVIWNWFCYFHMDWLCDCLVPLDGDYRVFRIFVLDLVVL